MKRTSTEEVTRTYCDVCGKECSRGSTGKGRPDYPGPNYQVCMESKYDIDLVYRKRGVTLNCEMLARLYTDYPVLANDNWKKLLEFEAEIDVLAVEAK